MPPKLVTITLNPAVDRSYTVPGYKSGGVFRPSASRVSAGGKGVNVARVWTALGGHAVATGLAGGRAGEYIREQIVAEGIVDAFITISGETRTAVAIADPGTGDEVIVNENGPFVSVAEQQAFLNTLPNLLQDSAFVAISGSAAPGIDPSYFADVVAICKRADVKVVLDAHGDNLVQGAGAKPFCIKPNREEAAILGVSIDTWRDAPAQAAVLRERIGVACVLISGGGDGAVLASNEGVWSAKPPKIDIVSTLGSGDSMSAGLMWGLATAPGDWANALRWAATCGTANAMSAGSGYMTAADRDVVWGRIQIDQSA